MPGSNSGDRHKGSTPGRKKYTAQDSKDVASCYIDLTTDEKTGLVKSGVEDLSGKLERAFNEVTSSHARVGKNLIQHWGVLNRECRVFDQMYIEAAKNLVGKSEEQIMAAANNAFGDKTSKMFKFEEAWRVLKQTGRIEKGDGFERIRRTPIAQASAGASSSSATGAAGKRKRTSETDDDVEPSKLESLLTVTAQQNAVSHTMAVYSSALAELAECRQWVTMNIPSDLDAETKASLEKLKTMGVTHLPKLIEQLEETKQAMTTSLESNMSNGVGRIL